MTPGESPEPAGPPPAGDGRPLEAPMHAAPFDPTPPAWMGHVPDEAQAELAAELDNDELPEWMRWVGTTPTPVDLLEAVENEASDPVTP